MVAGHSATVGLQRARTRRATARLDDPDDFVRLEVEAALKRNIPVGAVLIDGAAMPRPDQLPESLNALCRRNAMPLSSGRDFRVHIVRLIVDIEKHLGLSRAKTYFNKGNEFADRGVYDLAIAEYTQAIRLNPQYTDAYVNRGSTYVEIDGYDNAISDYRRSDKD